MRGHRQDHRWRRSLGALLVGVLGFLLTVPAHAAGTLAPLTPEPARPPRSYSPDLVVTPLEPGPAGTTVGGPRPQPGPAVAGAQTATGEFRATYTATVPEEAKPAITAALGRWAAALRITIPVEVSIDWQALAGEDPGNTVIGLAGPTVLIANFPGAPRNDIFYPAALANQLTGIDQVPETSDITIILADRDDWEYATSGPADPGLVSLSGVVLHELVHGLGFVSAFGVDEDGAGRTESPGGLPSIFDTFVVDADGTPITGLPDPSAALGQALTQGLFWDGTLGIQANGGARPVLFSPSPFQPESSIAHLDEATYPAGHPDSLTTPGLFGSEANDSTGTVAPAMLADMGWSAAAAEGDPAPAPSPNLPLPDLPPVPTLPVSQPLPDPAGNPPSAPVGTGGNPSLTPAPAASPTAAGAAGTTSGTLPRTGFPIGVAALGGAGAVATGSALVRRAQWTRPVSRAPSLS